MRLERLSVASLAALLLPASAAAQDPAAPSKLSVHGYLSQAYATADEHPILGIPEEGTTDYRTLALQFRYALDENDTFVVQLSHERFGRSPFAALKDDLELDWAFYEHRFSDHVAVKVGKLQIPLGIYNEVRDVGTLLPFYRPAFNFYGEGVFTSETVDGLELSLRFAPEARWSPSLDVYYGGWDLLEIDPNTAQASRGRAKDDLGFQAWLETPVEGLRFGAGASRFTLRDQLLAPPAPKATVKTWHVSADGSFDRFTLRAELAKVTFRPGRYLTWNAHLGVKLTSRLTVNLQADRADLRFAVPQGPVFDRSFNTDYAAGLNYAVRSNVVVKAEGHRARGFRIDEPVDVFFGPPQTARYAILSLSVSF